jgi:hypothetical protein
MTYTGAETHHLKMDAASFENAEDAAERPADSAEESGLQEGSPVPPVVPGTVRGTPIVHR